MKRNLSIVIVLFFCAHTALAQNDSAAKALYLEAETAYFDGRYRESLNLLREAENLLGKTTPRVHFLKVLVYQLLALEDIKELPVAKTTIREYLEMDLPPSHARNETLVRQIESSIGSQAQGNHQARINAQLLAEKIAWQEEASQRRIGVAVGLAGKDWAGTEFGIILGSRSRMWVLGISSMTGKNILVDEVTAETAEKLRDKPDGQPLKSTLMHIGYFQGIRILPRERDFIKPFIGVRGIYQGEYRRTYHAASETSLQPDAETLGNIRKYDLDPADFFEMRVSFQSTVSMDVVVGAMLHVKKITLFTGIDLINSNMIQIGAAFKL